MPCASEAAEEQATLARGTDGTASDLVWGQSYSSSGDPVKIYIGYLRRKIERDPSDPELVETVRGFGYRYRRGG